MHSKHKSQLIKPGLSLGEIATLFLTTIPIESKPEAQQGIYRFIRWYGEDKQADTLTAQEVVNYVEQYYTSTAGSLDNLTFIKRFLSYAYKQGYISSNLGTHVRIKKVSHKSSSYSPVKIEEPVILTSQGYAELKDRLAILKNERPRLAEELRKAAADKDFRENAPLEAAREQQGYLEAQIREIEDILKRAKIAESEQQSSIRVSIGDMVTLEDKQSGEKIKYILVGSRESNVKQGKISIASPMGQSLFSREIGETINVNAPLGTISYHILDITRP